MAREVAFNCGGLVGLYITQWGGFGGRGQQDVAGGDAHHVQVAVLLPQEPQRVPVGQALKRRLTGGLLVERTGRKLDERQGELAQVAPLVGHAVVQQVCQARARAFHYFNCLC